jgi:polar amino acid transport system substrate-binding protein
MRKLAVLLLILLLAVFAAACGSDDDESAGGDTAAATAAAETAAAADECAPDQLELKSAGKLTIGTDNPAYPPWFGGEEKAPWKISDPTSGEGFESAVAYAVAEELGFERADVEWKVVPFNQSFRPGPKDFDFDINQISYTEERDQAVDFSESYYDVNQALVTVKGSSIEGAKTLEDLKDAKLGAQIGTTSYRYITDTIQPSEDPSVYDTNNDVISALKAKQIDGIVVDLPTAFFIVAAELDDGVIVGQFPAAGEQERFGMVFNDGSPLVACVDEALQTLKDDGTLADIQQEWLSDKASAPVIE